MPVDQDEVDFGMGNPQRLDHVFDRGAEGKEMGKADSPSFRREKVVQFGVEAKMCVLHCSQNRQVGYEASGTCRMMRGVSQPAQSPVASPRGPGSVANVR